MGGYGSGRWNFHTARETVEHCKRLAVGTYLEGLRKIERGEARGMTYTSSWNRGGEPAGRVGVVLSGDRAGVKAWLNYTSTPQGGKPEDHLYQIGTTYTLTAWGARRYWWSCPSCGKRCATLYLPGDRTRFACRTCCNLTYKTCKESHHDDAFMGRLLAGTSWEGVSPGEFKALLDWKWGENITEKPPKKIRRYLQREAARFAQEYKEIQEQRKKDLALLLADLERQEAAEAAAKLARQLTPGDLCEKSGLTVEDLAALAAARLIVPEKTGRYRPKLAGWAAKLAALLHDGWTTEEVRRWARGRWAAPNPRTFPPDRAAWRMTPGAAGNVLPIQPG